MLETFGGNFTIKQIFKENWGLFFKKYGNKLRPAIIENVGKIMACGDKDKMGYHLYQCSDCGEKNMWLILVNPDFAIHAEKWRLTNGLILLITHF